MRSRSLPLLPFVLLLAMSGCGYNQIQTLDERAAQAEQQIKVQLQRRHDLIGNLVNTVKGYAAHEEAVFTRVAEARAGLAGAVTRGDPREMAQANEQMTGAKAREYFDVTNPAALEAPTVDFSKTPAKTP